MDKDRYLSEFIGLAERYEKGEFELPRPLALLLRAAYKKITTGESWAKCLPELVGAFKRNKRWQRDINLMLAFHCFPQGGDSKRATLLLEAIKKAKNEPLEKLGQRVRMPFACTQLERHVYYVLKSGEKIPKRPTDLVELVEKTRLHFPEYQR